MRYISLSLALLFVVIGYGLQTETTQIQLTPTPIQSIFIEDTCAPPCWFGLMPGESTTDDAKKMFTHFSDVFDNDCSFCESLPRELSAGSWFDFAWKNYTRKDTYVFAPGMTNSTQNPSHLSFENSGILKTVYVVADREITLRQTIQALGTPDWVYVTWYPNYMGENLTLFEGLFIYVSERLNIQFDDYLSLVCKSDSINKNFNVDFSIYYSIENATKIVPLEVGNEDSLIYPQLLLPPDSTSRLISGEQWEKFVNGKSSETCEDFYNALPTDYVLPTLPWPSPTVSPVPSVTP